MKIFLLLLVAGIFLAPSFMVDSHGLSCAAPNVTQSFEESDVVFAGTVVSKEYSAPSDERTLIAESLFSIKEPFKGNLQDQITVTSNERFWGINFTLGEEYLVFADYFGAEVQTQLCGPTSPIEFSDVDTVRNISEYIVLSPLKQFKSGIAIEEIQCRDSLVTVLKFDGSPACVTYQTGEVLVERRWATCEDGIFHGRGHPCGPRSSPGIMDQESYKTVYPRFDGVTEIVNPEHESLEYRATSPVIDETYLSKNVQQWNDVWDFEMQAEYEKYGDEFYIELGKLLMKNEMQYQMNNLGIVNSEEGFEVVGGSMLTSLPPHIGFSSIVHATDGHYYWLQGTTHANQVSYYKTTQLQYPDPTEVDFDQKSKDGIQKISILPKGDSDLKSTPRLPVLSQPGKVEFYNETPGLLTVFLNKEGLTEFSFDTEEQLSIKANSGETWDFAEPGSYHWKGEVPTIIDGKKYELNTGGAILVLADDMGSLSKKEQMETARTMLSASGLPITGMGQKGEEDTLYISLSEAIEELLPESRQYYLERAQNLVPFDISIRLDG